jgi:hypothetical protein
MNNNNQNNKDLKGIMSFFDRLTWKRIIGWITLTSFTLTLIWSSGLRAETFEEWQKRRQQFQQGQSVSSPSDYSVAAQMQGGNYQFVEGQDGSWYLMNNQGQTVGTIETLDNGQVQITLFDNSNPQQKVSFTTVVNKEDLKNLNYEDVLRNLAKQLNESRISGQKYDETVQRAAVELLSWRQEFLSSDPQKQQQMCEQIGITREQAESFSKETKQKVLSFLMSKGGKNLPEGNVTTQELANFTNRVNILFDQFKAAVTRLFANLVKVFGQKEDGTSIEISIEQIQKIAAEQGIDLSALSLDINELKTILSHIPVIAHLTCEKEGEGNFVVVTGIKDGKVSYIGSDGNVATMSLEEFQKMWSNKGLVLSVVGSRIGDILTPDVVQNTKGTFISKMFKIITQIFGNESVKSVQAKLDVIFDKDTDLKTLQQLSQDKNKWVSLAAKRVLELVGSGLDRESAAKVAKLMFVSEHSRNPENKKIATEQLVQYCKNLPNGVKEKVINFIISNTQNKRLAKILNNLVVPEQQGSGQQATTQQPQGNAQQVISMIENFLQQFLNATPEQKAAMAAQLGL